MIVKKDEKTKNGTSIENIKIIKDLILNLSKNPSLQNLNF